MEESIRAAAELFGRALRDSPVVADYWRVEAEAWVDGEVLRLEAELEDAYDSLVQRQSAGEMLSRGEVEAYHELERQAQNHPLLMKRELGLTALEDYFSEVHNMLSGHLGLNFKDLVD